MHLCTCYFIRRRSHTHTIRIAECVNVCISNWHTNSIEHWNIPEWKIWLKQISWALSGSAVILIDSWVQMSIGTCCSEWSIIHTKKVGVSGGRWSTLANVSVKWQKYLICTINILRHVYCFIDYSFSFFYI